MGHLDERVRRRIQRLVNGPPKIAQERLAEIGGWGHQTSAGKYLNRVQDADLRTTQRYTEGGVSETAQRAVDKMEG